MNRKVKVLSRKVVFSKGPITLSDSMVQMPDGSKCSRQILEHNGAVVIIPKTRKGKYILIRQYRFAARDWLYEFPAGGVEKGENLAAAAKRELTEETGFKPLRLTKAVDFYPTPGICAEVMYLYLADKLVPAWAQKDDDEDIETFEFSLKQIGRMIRTKKIRDAKTIIGYFYLKNPGEFRRVGK